MKDYQDHQSATRAENKARQDLQDIMGFKDFIRLIKQTKEGIIYRLCRRYLVRYYDIHRN